MNQNKSSRIILLVILGIVLNVSGKALANHFALPLWLDSFGTVLVAYLLGPVSGAAVGLTGNIIYGMSNPTSLIYGLTSISIGVIVGLFARKKWFETLFGTMAVCSLVTIASIIISTPLNIFLYDGVTGNIWGDGVIEYLMEHRVYRIVCYVMGEFYIDFLDKVLTLVILCVFIRLKRRMEKELHTKKNKNSHKSCGAFVLLFMAALSLHTFIPVYAGEEQNPDTVDFYSYVQTVYSDENGLPCGTANDIAQTKDGILWIGTYAGLYRYNGSEFRPMNEYSSVKNVNCLYVDQEGRMWIGTNDNGLSMSIGENISNVIDVNSGLPSNSVRSVIQSADGDYYVGTADAMQVLALNGGLQILDQIPEVIYAHSLSADEDGYVAAVAASGQLFVLKDRKIVLQGKLETGQEIYTCCLFGEDGLLYVATSENQIFVYDISEGKLQLKKTYECQGLKQINSLFFGADGMLFACADNGVGYVTQNGTYYKINLSQFNNSIDSMTVDYQGDFWFTSSRLGLLRMSKSSFSDVYGAVGMEQTVVNTVTMWNDRLYIGTDEGLDIVANGESRQISNELTEALENIRIRCIRSDSRGHLWICTYGQGLWEVAEDGSVTVYDSTDDVFCDWVRVVTETTDGEIVAAGDAGIAYIRNGKVQKIVPYGSDLCNAMILCLLDTGNGVMLAGTDGDGIVALRDGEVVRRLTGDEELSSGVVLRIVKTVQEDGYYIVTSNGLCFMDQDYNVRVLEDFPYSNNYDVWTMEDGRIFVLGSAGIYVMDEQQLLSGREELSYELLDTKRGLAAALTANSWNYKDSDGRLYLSSDKGVYMLDMADYGSAQKSCRMKVSAIKLDDVTYQVERGEAFSISRDAAKIEIFPEIINFTLEDPYISYQLVGFDAEETVLPSSELGSIVYTNLPSGKYVFRLAILDSNKNVLEESNYALVKELRNYDTWWFHAYMLAVAGLAVAWFTWFIGRTQIQRTLNFQKKELEFVRQQVKMGNETIMAIAKTVDAKDENTSQHSQRVSEYAVMLAREMGFEEEECENLRKAALLHDIGKIGIPDRILNKPARLTDEEYAVMKTHVTSGAEILKDFTVVEHVVDGALYHHERYDGSGYMSGLKGEEIPIYGRIIGVADAFDAMTQNRVYRKKLDMDFVLGELERCKGTQFDPGIADIMIRLVKEGKIDLSEIRPEKGGES